MTARTLRAMTVTGANQLLLGRVDSLLLLLLLLAAVAKYVLFARRWCLFRHGFRLMRR